MATQSGLRGREQVATRMRDSTFKRALGALPVGAGIVIDGPSGSLTLLARMQAYHRVAWFVFGCIECGHRLNLDALSAYWRQPSRQALSGAATRGAAADRRPGGGGTTRRAPARWSSPGR